MFNYERSRERGQILPLFAITLTMLVLMASLLVDASWGLLVRRQYQDAADAAAMAAANAQQSLEHNCSSSTGGTVPKPAVRSAAASSVAANLPGYTGVVNVKCRPDLDPSAVEVDLSAKSPGFFGAVAGYNGFNVSTTAVAVNGPSPGGRFSVVILDPTACKSIEFGGSINTEFDGSLKSDSNCADPNSGAINESSSSATVKFNNGAGLWARGTITGFSSVLVPASTPRNEFTGYTPDPYLGLTNPWEADPSGWSGATAQTLPSKTVAGTYVLHPGRYDGGITPGSNQTYLLLPGVYIMNNGGFTVGSNQAVYSINATGVDATNFNPALWSSQCTKGSCGVLIYNRGAYNSNPSNCNVPTTKMGYLNITAGATQMLRPYNTAADTTSGVAGYAGREEWNNMLFWQDKQFTTGSASALTCDATFAGGGAVWMMGGIYVPTGGLQFQGGSGGGGGVNDMTIQFVSRTLTFGGSSYFHFIYNVNDLPRQNWYGLVQ